MPTLPIDPLKARQQRVERGHQAPAPKIVKGQVRKTISFSVATHERLAAILAAIQEGADPTYTYHALMVALLDQVSRDVLAGDYTLEVEQTRTTTVPVRIQPERG
jgi:hypothetical protein